MTNKYDVLWTTQFKKDYKAAKRQKKDVTLLFDVIEMLANDIPLPPRQKSRLPQKEKRLSYSFTANPRAPAAP